MSGREIAEEIRKRKGGKPSPGTIYPALKSLKEDGFILNKREGKEIVYRLSGEGKGVLKVSKARFCQIFTDVFKG